MGTDRGIRSIGRDRRGAAVVELALALPILVLLLFGIVTYGSWIALHHAVQQGANEAVRAAIAGLSPDERVSLAREAAERTLDRGYAVRPEQLTVSVADDGAMLTVAVSYDAARNPLLSLPLIPLPSPTIERRATARLAGL